MLVGWWWGGFWLFFFGFVSFISRWKHLLSVLLSLELMMLGVFFLMVGYSNLWVGGSWLGLIYLGFAVCEGGLGLGLVVSLVRCHGGDCLMGFVGDVGDSY